MLPDSNGAWSSAAVAASDDVVKTLFDRGLRMEDGASVCRMTQISVRFHAIAILAPIPIFTFCQVRRQLERSNDSWCGSSGKRRLGNGTNEGYSVVTHGRQCHGCPNRQMESHISTDSECSSHSVQINSSQRVHVSTHGV